MLISSLKKIYRSITLFVKFFTYLILSFRHVNYNVRSLFILFLKNVFQKWFEYYSVFLAARQFALQGLIYPGFHIQAPNLYFLKGIRKQ